MNQPLLHPAPKGTGVTTPTPRRTLEQTFAELQRQQRIGLFPFIPAGYPDLPTTAALLRTLEASGASAIEVGFPFSDSIADGPVVQEAFIKALENHFRVHDLFDTIGAVRGDLSVPLVAMVSFSIVYRYGTERFLTDARTAGFDAILIPDLPPPQAQEVCRQVRAAGLDTVLLLAPSTPPQRRKQIADLSSGFIYYLSVSGVTGARATLPEDLESNVRQLKTMTRRPVAVGFGVSQPAHLQQLSTFADAAIVGSALVRQITAHMGQGQSAILNAAGSFCRDLLKTPA